MVLAGVGAALKAADGGEKSEEKQKLGEARQNDARGRTNFRVLT